MGKYDGWSEFFASIEQDDVVFSMEQLEEIAGSSLPRSARRYETWWSSAQYHAKWVEHGFVASPLLSEGQVRFRRGEPRLGRPRKEPSRQSEASVAGMEDRLILLGCVAQKRSLASPARDLYTSPLWEKRRGYADASGQPWGILSAEHGLVMPDQVILPYDRALKNASPVYQREWSRRVSESVIDLCHRLGIETVEVHAGADYLEHGLISALNGAGIKVLWPLRGMRIGEQLAWYGGRPSESATPSDGLGDAPLPPATSGPEQPPASWPRIVELREVGPFEYRLPDSTESFEYGWEGTYRVDGRLVGFRHGIGGRVVYGRHRTHTVTWIGYDPVVEGVAADDYESSLSLLSLIKDASGAMVRNIDAVPPGYGALPVVDHRSEIDVAYSRNGLAVKLRVDDVAGWLRHAELRRGSQSSAASSPTPDKTSSATPLEHPKPSKDLGPSPQEPLSSDRKRAVAEALVAFGETAAAQLSAEAGSVEFTEEPEANALVKENSFAFLIGVIADQGIKAERAWAIPKELERRLGHLDPRRIVAEPEAVYRAFVEPSALHRYVKTVPAWVISAADRVLTEYGGEAAAIWDDTPTAAELQVRLRRFDGIAQKKAAMAVELLERDLGIPIRDMRGSDIAYDVHVRRVFLRTGLAEKDDLDHMVETARKVYPERPGAIDTPAWVVGRTWCRPAAPDCPICVLSSLCPKRIEAGSSIRGY